MSAVSSFNFHLFMTVDSGVTSGPDNDTIINGLKHLYHRLFIV